MGNASSTKAHLETAHKTGTLSLANSGLTKLPDGMEKLQNNLRTLDVSGNKLGKPESVPGWVGKLQMLKTLVMVGCELTEIPEGVYSLGKLETLNVSSNAIRTLSARICQLKNLRTLNITSNNIETLPDSISQCKHLEALESSNNRLQSLPSSIGNLNIVELNANRNRLSDIPTELKDCTRLKTLRLEENCLTLSDNVRVVLAQSQVSLILLDGNLFTQKELDGTKEYESYMERFTATKKKIF